MSAGSVKKRGIMLIIVFIIIFVPEFVRRAILIYAPDMFLDGGKMITSTTSQWWLSVAFMVCVTLVVILLIAAINLFNELFS